MTTLQTAFEYDRAYDLFPIQQPVLQCTYFRTVMERNPVAYWRFHDAASGYEFIGAHHAVLDVGYDPSQPGTAETVAGLLLGDPDRAVRLAGGGSFQVPHDTFMDTPDFTLEGLFHLESLPEHGGLFGRASAEVFGWAILTDEDGFHLTTDLGTSSFEADLEPTHFALVGGDDYLVLYFNAAEVARVPYDPATNLVSAGLSFGSPFARYSPESLPGILDEFVLYDFRLTPTQIAEDHLIWSLGQTFTIETAVETEKARYLYPRGREVSMRQVMVNQDPWAYWSGHGLITREFGRIEGDMVIFDHGPREHDGVGERGTEDIKLGPDTPEINSPLMFSMSYGWRASNDYLATSEYTVAVWLAVDRRWRWDFFSGSPHPEAYPAGGMPLVTCAPETGAPVFDKCLYLDFDGHLCWRTGVGVDQETIVDPDPFIRDGIARLVIASVGPDGAKLRVSKTTKATGSNTASWDEPQKVFLYNGGTDVDNDFDTTDYDPNPLAGPDAVFDLVHGASDLIWVSPAIFDRQLSDDETDFQHDIGRSFRNTAHFWGNYDDLQVHHTREFSGLFYRWDDFRTYTYESSPGLTYLAAWAYDRSPYTNIPFGSDEDDWPTYPMPSLLMADPNSRSIVLAPDTGVYGGFVWDVQDRTTQEIAHFVLEPYTNVGTQALTCFVRSFYSVPLTSNFLNFHWQLRIIDGYLTWEGRGLFDDALGAVAPNDVFVHSQPVVVGAPNALGFRLNDGEVELWVNGAKETFARYTSDGWYVFAGEDNVINYYTAFLTPVEGDITTSVPIEQYTGQIGDFVITNGSQFTLPPLFFEDLARAVTTAAIELGTAYEIETADEIAYSLAVANQDITLETAEEVDTADTLNFALVIGTAFEEEIARGFAVPVELLTEGDGVTTIESEGLTFLGAELRLTILEPIVVRAPTSITVVAYGGQAQTPVTFYIDGIEVYTTDLDSDGHLGPTSINLSTTLGTIGDHTLTIYQMTEGGETGDSEIFTVLRDPPLHPNVAGVDAPSVEVPGALVMENDVEVRHWVLQDLLAEAEGGIGSYIFPHNPRSMTSPHHEHVMTTRQTTSHDGVTHIFQSGNLPKEWTFTGYCPSQEQQEAIEAYRALNRRFYIIDHHNRAWKVVPLSAEFVPRKRQTYNDVVTDWGSDFTITVVVVDQNWGTPG